MYQKIKTKLTKWARGKLPKKHRLRYLVVAIGVVGGTMCTPGVGAESCPEVKIVFARGSGEERWSGKNYLAFEEALGEKLKLTAIEYDFLDLDYPAVGIDKLNTLVGAYFGAGESYEFGESVNAGVRGLVRVVNRSCPETKYVIAGYSQGAMVVSKALGSLNANKIIYAATFGDPKIYLPEGAGVIPVACRGENLSNYRVYVPDCQAYEGMLGSYRPYQPEAYINKLGTWCNKGDVMCSSHFNVGDHVSYVEDNLYEDAAKLIFRKITDALGVENDYVSLHDTAILIDSTGSMQGLIAGYKAEALRLAEKTLASGGRVALYDYRDLKDPYQPVKRCDFETCTPESFQAGLDAITVGGGGDTPESLLSASLTVMQELEWKVGSTKSLVVLTDAGYHAPDWDGTEFINVMELSKKIDPVNIYVITAASMTEAYTELAVATGGRVVTTADDLGELTNYIMGRVDSLPMVVEELRGEKPVAEVEEVEELAPDTVRVRFSTTGARVVVVVNDTVLGVTEDTEIIVAGLDRTIANTIALVPLSDGTRGDRVSVEIGALVLPGAPNTGVGW
ncbi:cutinase family protein [Candidatus Saccharibacteria bacterium]|nr:cutinase family protein [Candidatus Saccharibacteria bacterium]